MATTTNYGWTTPDDTALVKDGAAAIRTLGSSVDTTTKNLNPETTLGDIAYRSSTSNVNTRLGIGSTGNILTVAAGVPSWAAPASAGGITLLSTTTLSGASVTISSIDQTYKNLQIIVFGATNATADGIFRIAPNGVTNITSISGRDEANYNNRLTYLNLNKGVTLYTDANNAWDILIYDYASTSSRKPVSLSGQYFENSAVGGITGFIGGGGINTTSAISSLVFTNSAGNLSTGTVLIYGVK